MPESKAREAEREAKKLAPYVEAALARQKFMPMPDDKHLPVLSALGRSIVGGEKDPKKKAEV